MQSSLRVCTRKCKYVHMYARMCTCVSVHGNICKVYIHARLCVHA